MPSFGSELQATLCRDSHNVFPPKGGENQGGCEADTKGRANTWLEELSLTLAEGTGTLCDIAWRRGLAKTAFQQTKWGKIEIEFFFPIPGSSDGTLAHFFFFVEERFYVVLESKRAGQILYYLMDLWCRSSHSIPLQL